MKKEKIEKEKEIEIEGLQELRTTMKKGNWDTLQEMLMDSKFARATNFIEAEKIRNSYENSEICLLADIAMQAIEDNDEFEGAMERLQLAVDKYVCSQEFWD